MSRILIIAEKPSVAREISQVISKKMISARGFLECETHVISWAVGHLVNISEPEEQNADWGKPWKLDRLPMIPQKFKLSVLPKTRDQFLIVENLMKREDVTEIVNATDAGREGELIFRRVYLEAGCSKPIKRLWANDMTEEGLKKALSHLLDGEEKRNLGLAAFARAEADWLVGMNYSRLLTLKVGELITVGRVQTPVLKMLVDRKNEIEHFTPKDFWTVEASVLSEDMENKKTPVEGERSGFESVWFAPPDYKESKIDKQEIADDIINKCKGSKGTILSVEKKAGKQNAPLLFDLTTLQREANSRYGYSAQETLNIAQNLYEKAKVITYPRTDSRYLTTELFKDVKKHLGAIYHLFPELTKEAASRVEKGKFVCVNDKKVSDHHAIIPTAKKVLQEKLSADEWKIFEMIARRFIAAFLPEAKFQSSQIWLDIQGEQFKSVGKIFQDQGWLKAEPWRAAEDNPLPVLRKGQKVEVSSLEAKKRKTKAPAHFTDATLLGAMETVGKLVEDEELREAIKERGLGTSATRAQIIETLVSRGYVEKDGKRLVATVKGQSAIAVIEKVLPDVVSPEMTGEWEKKLKDIESGQFTYGQFMQEIKSSIFRSVHVLRDRYIRKEFVKN